MRRCTLLLAALLCLAAPAAAMTSGRPPAQTDRRFDAVAGFTRTEWAGINNIFGNAVLISPDRIVIPRHLINEQFRNRASVDGAPAEYTVRFRRRPDGGLGDLADLSTFHHVRIREWVFPAGRAEKDDIAIGILETPVLHISPMVIDFNPRVNAKTPILRASWGPESSSTGIVPKGRLLIGEVRLRSAGSVMKLAPKSAQMPTEVVRHDSGSPILAMSGSSVRMIGLVSTTVGGPAFKSHANTRLFPKARR